jgi:hypothetical protein
MVYAVQNYKAYFGIYASSGIYKTKNPQCFRDWICLHPQVDGAGFLSYIYQMMHKVQNKPYSSIHNKKVRNSEKVLIYSLIGSGPSLNLNANFIFLFLS